MNWTLLHKRHAIEYFADGIKYTEPGLREPFAYLAAGDCLELLRDLPDNSVDLVFGSPPYEGQFARYGFKRKCRGEEWVAWMLERWAEMQRVSRGLVCMVVESKTSNGRWGATPALLMADLHRGGYLLRKPPLYLRWGVSGSGGPQWLRNRYEFIICTSKTAKLPYADNLACASPPKCKPGGAPSHRKADGSRAGGRAYKQVKLANPGNLIDCGANTHHGQKTKNEAPFPQKLPDFFIRSYAPPHGVVLDPFCGGGTTIVSAKQHGRNGVGFDIRPCQIAETERRLNGMG